MMTPPGRGQFRPQGHNWQDLCRVPLNICYTLNIQALGLVVLQKKIFKCFSHYKPMADNVAPGVRPIWTPGSWLAGIIKGLTKHCFTQNIKALGLMVSEKKIFLRFFPFISLWRPMTPGAWPTWTPGASLAGFIKGTTKCCYILNK